MSWLADGLAKLQLFTRPGVVFWTLFATTVQITSTFLFAPRLMFTQFVLPLRVIFVMAYITRGVFYSFSPLSIYCIGKHSTAFLNTKVACLPKYWYLLVLSLMFSLAYHAIVHILYWDSTEMNKNSFLFEIFNLSLVLLMGTVYGIATATIEKRCDALYSEVNGNLAENGKSLLEHYKVLKNSSQLVMLVVLVFRTSYLILMVIFQDIELTITVKRNKTEKIKINI